MSSRVSVTPLASQPFAAKLSVALLTGLTFALCLLLWPHWLHNPDLSHGLLMPVVFLLLLRESRGGTARFLPGGKSSGFALLACLALGLAALAAGGLYAASLGWSHDLVGFTLNFSFVCLLAAGLVVVSQASVRLIPFNWSALVAVALWLLCAPIPPGTYSRLTLTLQLMVTENVLRALHLLGIAAVRHGNILELGSSSVGIEDACSGVRSLISCVFAGLLFSASLVRRPWSRALLILLAAPLALAMNFIRSLTLTLLVNSGVKITGGWHDATGFAVLAVTAALLIGLALLLERRAKSSAGVPACIPDRAGEDACATTAAGQALRATSPRLLAASLAFASALAIFFYVSTRPALHRDAPVPDLAALLPIAPADWQVDTANDLYQFSGILHTDHLAQRTYTRLTDHGPVQIILYLAYWRPGQASVSLVSSHTPDACWPGAGWQAVAIPTPRVALTVGPRRLPEAEARSFLSGDFPQNVWYWHLFDGRPLAQQSTDSPAKLLSLAWRYGFRRDGDQLFVRVSSNRPWTEIAHEPVIESFFARLQPLGL